MRTLTNARTFKYLQFNVIYARTQFMEHGTFFVVVVVACGKNRDFELNPTCPSNFEFDFGFAFWHHGS